jgi:hypothetical protein
MGRQRTRIPTSAPNTLVQQMLGLSGVVTTLLTQPEHLVLRKPHIS